MLREFSSELVLHGTQEFIILCSFLLGPLMHLLFTKDTVCCEVLDE